MKNYQKNPTKPTEKLPFVFAAAIIAPLLAPIPLLAQQTNQEPTRLRPVVVTGSLIPTTAEEVRATPVEVISAAELERRDVRAVEQLARVLPSAIGGGNFGT